MPMKLYINKYSTAYGARTAVCVAKDSFSAHELLVNNTPDHIHEEYSIVDWEAIDNVECLGEARFVTEHGYVE